MLKVTFESQQGNDSFNKLHVQQVIPDKDFK